ncbi:hypothetical protein [Oceanicola sp. S124]|nr:hypothetical protein [Oceanicola sp. S124]
MKNTLLKTTLTMAGKSVLPALLGALGTLAAVAYAEGYSAFCGL